MSAHRSNVYDGIVIGAGHHGLILANYMAKAGLDVLLLERRLTYGGGLSTEERTLPGFYHNLHSINHFSITATPWYRDLELDTTVTYLTPRYEFAQPHRDGTGLVFSRDIDETVASISRFSADDARTFREWNAKAERMTREIFLKERFAAPLSKADRENAMSHSSIGREFLDLTQRQPLEAVNDLFEDERVRVLFLFKLSLFGTVLQETLGEGSPVGSLIRAFDLTTGYELCQGGSWNLARGLMEKFLVSGGTFLNQTHIARIVVDAGKAVGVETDDGRSFTARNFVASTVDVHQTFAEMIGEDQLSPAMVDKLDNFQYTPWSLFGLHLALNEAPDYLAAKFDPNINRAMKYNIGAETIETLLSAHDDVQHKKIPDAVQFGAGALSVLDPKQAPPGKHTAYAWHVVPYEVDSGPEQTGEIREELTERILEKWASYAPNVTRENILGSYVHTPQNYSDELINMRYGDIMMGSLASNQVMYNHFGYRGDIQRLYMAGSAAHPNGSLSGGAGYITAGVIADDLGMTPWWKRTDIREALTQLL